MRNRTVFIVPRIELGAKEQVDTTFEGLQVYWTEVDLKAMALAHDIMLGTAQFILSKAGARASTSSNRPRPTYSLLNRVSHP
jgi:hypothetical protein